MLYTTMCKVGKIDQDLSFEMDCLETLAKKRIANVEEIAILKTKIEAYERFLKLLDTRNPEISDPDNVIIRRDGHLYCTDKWNAEATDVNSKDYSPTKKLHIKLKCID